MVFSIDCTWLGQMIDCLCNVELDVIHIDSAIHRLLSEGIVLCKLITEILVCLRHTRSSLPGPQ